MYSDIPENSYSLDMPAQCNISVNFNYKLNDIYYSGAWVALSV
jgi:hypothetical protein